MEDYEIERLQNFVNRYDEFQKHGVAPKTTLSIEERDMVAMMVIDICCISEQEQNPQCKNNAAWHNKDIDNFVKLHNNFYKRFKAVRDSLIAHLDHNISKQERVNYSVYTMSIYTTFELKEFYNLCKQIIKKENSK